ncbi:TetR-like C-terminal domain-containing protein [Acetobacterium bakii]|uniref:HTH tetR-type domain-containing protein n=1 Tax=Acetobacterium bakii TaxID=52689 RepID=A0A0L6TYZ4_9FIRM|nr:TetR-like C-terminal domain-containing protein [Acetobacterium bakii]KNZ41486.1 hypothetical protein AKG39_11715 [Acetobacterium bakii]
MGTKKSEQTKINIQKSLMQILNKKNFLNITVKEVCGNANMHRTTFYLYYQNLDEVLCEVEQNLLDEITEQSKNINYIIPTFESQNMNMFTHERWEILDYFKENKEYLIPLLNPHSNLNFIYNYKKTIYSQIILTLKRINASYGVYEEYVIRYLISGIVETLYYWLKNDDLSVEEFTDFLLRFNSMNSFIIPEIPS